ncbi:uncharacterized protein LOC116196694 [Punica granatum]|uniref:Uncharacterized protein LOC116196694 n=1 Tax=Punica granatum TaxID=22663 RepID=A0A6P8CGZ9_PUNGR|nr:uncharacterized protein LOC116196694 [Punica granatum]
MDMGSGADGSRGVGVISSIGCSKLMVGFSNFFPSSRDLPSSEPTMSPARSSVNSRPLVQSNGPFAGLVICVTGLSKEARKQVMVATERLGGLYSPNLHHRCTHLVVQSFGGRKFEHALKHGSKNGLFIVTLGWFVDSVRRNVRLSESLYTVKSIGDGSIGTDNLNQMVGSYGAENSCLPNPVSIHEGRKHEMDELLSSGRTSRSTLGPMTLSGQSLFIDSDISTELRNKVVAAASTREGATVVDKWFVGCNASYVVCEATSAARYLGHSNNLVTPLWVLKTAKEKYVQRLIHLSADLARQLGSVLENYQVGTGTKVPDGNNILREGQSCGIKVRQAERQQLVNLAKLGLRNRRGQRMKTCEAQAPVRPITLSSLLESICWSVSEPTSTASVYVDSLSSEDGGECQTPIIFNGKGDAKDSELAFANFTRPLSESEKNELIFKHHFLTILFPIDQFAEIGPSSRTFFSDRGFTCIQVLDQIYGFYQENMLAHEVEVAIHTDSRHADRLRSVYASKESIEQGSITFKRIDFLGSRRSFEMLKRVRGDNNSNVYELLIRA